MISPMERVQFEGKQSLALVSRWIWANRRRHPLARMRSFIWTLLVIVGLLSSLSASASAEFVRPFKSVAMEGTPTGPFGEIRCIAINTREGQGNSDNVWVGDATSRVIDEFNSSNEFLVSLTGKPVGSCAYDDSTGELISTEGEEWIAVDNSASMGVTTGDVYIAREGSFIKQGYVERVNEKGEPANFTCLEHGTRPEYISGNRLIGKPGEPTAWENSEAVGGITVSSSGASAGDIYVIDKAAGDILEVDVFSSAGCFEQVIKGTINNNGEKEELFSGTLNGLAIDPTNDDILIKGSSGNGGWIIGEFTSLGEYLGKITGPSPEVPFGTKGDRSGIAVNAEGDLYAGMDEVNLNEKHEVIGEKYVVDEFGEGAYFPGAVTGGITGAGPSSVTLNGTVRGAYNGVKKETLILSNCYFQYVTEAEYQESLSEKKNGFSGLKPGDPGSEIPCVLAGGGSPVGLRLEEKNHAVDAFIENLHSGTVYHYRVVAETSGAERGGVKEGAGESFAAPDAPSVGTMSVEDVSSSYADLHAEVDPLGSDTTYRFEYIDEAGVVEVTPEVGIGSGDSDVGVVQQVDDLLPGTTYRVRVIAKNAFGQTVGVDGSGAYEMFTTLPASAQVLPDGRSYELVTPPNKGDAEDMFGVSKEEIFGENFDVGYSSVSGDEFILTTKAAFGSFAAQGENAYVFSRSKNTSGEAEWGFKAFASPSLGVQSFQSIVHGPNFSTVGAGDIIGKEQEQERVDDLVGPPGGPYTVVMSTSSGSSHVVGGSTDMSHVVVESTDYEMPTTPLPLCDSAQENLVEKQAATDAHSTDLYEWSADRRCLLLVNVKSASEGDELISSCGAALGQGSERAGGSHYAVSGDGSNIFFTAPDPDVSVTGSHCWFESGLKWNNRYTPQVYMRTGENTLEVSAPEPGVEPNVTYPSVFVGASEDGSKVFFVTKTELTAGAVKAKTTGLELYECEVVEVEEGGAHKPKCSLTRVSQGISGTEGNVHFVAAISADGSAVYFDAGAKLTPDALGGGLYRYETATGATTYVAPEGEYPNPEPFMWYEAGEPRGEFVFPVEVGLNSQANYYTTRNGEFFVFESPAGELYRYDANSPVSAGEAGAIPENPACVSCSSSGLPPVFGSEFARSGDRSDNPVGGPPRPISEEASSGPEGGENNGSRVFFDTAESLVPQDTNGKVDVYEWEENGVESCRAARGCLSLITSGQDSLNSFFLDSSENGSNVFFGTHAQLVPQDTDTEGDLYDARVCTVEEPCVKPPVGNAGQCEGDACAASSPASTGLALASSTFTGAGNLSEVPPPKTEKKCAKGKHLSHGKCVKAASKRKGKVKKKSRATTRREGKTRKVKGAGSGVAR
jgi:hypothetical protein